MNTGSRSVGLWVYKFLLLEEAEYKKALIWFGIVRASAGLGQVWVQVMQSQLSPSGAAGLWGAEGSVNLMGCFHHRAQGTG